jgi:hypothetical protein
MTNNLFTYNIEIFIVPFLSLILNSVMSKEQQPRLELIDPKSK